MVERPTVKPQRLLDRDATQEAPWVGRQIAGRYRVVRPLGEGGMGSIFLAEHLTLGRKVALKVLIDELAGKESIRKRFEREARTLSALHHPNIVAVSDFGVEEATGTPFLVMELAKGEDLAQRLENGRPTPQQAYEIFRQLLRGVSHAHKEGLVHRDLKPSNVMVRILDDHSIHVQVLDFGLARFGDDDSRGGPQLTRAGAILGTPAYMAPEQASGEGATPASDVYAAALILYEMLAARRPFEAREPTKLLRAHLMEEAPPLSLVAGHLAVPPELDAFLARGLTKAQSARFTDAAEMLAAFERLPLPTERGSNPTPGLGAGGLTLASGKHAAQTLMQAGRKVPLVVWLAGAGALVVVAILTVLLVDWNGDEPPPVSSNPPITGTGVPMPPGPAAKAPSEGAAIPTAMAADSEPEPSAMEEELPEAPPPPPSNTSADLPPELQAAHARLARSSRRLPRSVEGTLHRYARSHPDDPRPHLLLGQSYGNGRALTDAVGEYQEAWEADPGARHDAKMKEHLLEAATTNSSRLRWTARQLISRAYSRAEILPAIEQRLASARGDQRRRLEQLRDQL